MGVETTDRVRYLKRNESRLLIGGVGEHESLFKYVALDGKRSWNLLEQTLGENQLIGSTVASLNDPFEGQARFVDDLSDSKIKECAKYFDSNERLVDASERSGFGGFDLMREEIDTRLTNTIKNGRILSFCRRSDSPLLWSHYARSHKGACLHFIRSAFTEPKFIVGRVNYAQNRPSIPKSLLAKIALAPEANHHPEDRRKLREEFYKAAFFVKPADWSYEEEVRVIYSTQHMTNAPFDKHGLLELVIGAKCEPEDAERLRELVDRLSPQTAVRKAVIDGDTFAVRFE